MSVHLIYYQQGHKMMEAVETEEAYRRYRDSQTQARLMEAIRHPKPETDVSAAKRKLVQFNYSCLPTEDGGLKGAKRLSKSVGMDIDHLSADEVELVAATAIDKKDELGLLMLERSARGGGLHLVFRRHPEMDQEANLRWASDLLGVEYDAGAKDITRVFFATTSEDLLYLHEDLFDNGECESFTGSEATFTGSKTTFTNGEATFAGSEATSANKEAASTASEATSETEADQAQPAAATASETTAASRPANHPLEAGEDAKEQKDEKGEKTASEEKPLCYKGIPTTASSRSGGPSTTRASTPYVPTATRSPSSWPSTCATSATPTRCCWTASSPATTDFPRRRKWPASGRPWARR